MTENFFFGVQQILVSSFFGWLALVDSWKASKQCSIFRESHLYHSS